MGARRRRAARGGSDGRGASGRGRGGSRALRALAGSALALPGIAHPVAADAPREKDEADYRFSYYLEDDIDASRLGGGSAERYEIQAHQFHYGTPFLERMDLDFNLVYETMSGASPIYVDTNNDVVMTGATIEEERIDFLSKGNYYFDSGRAALAFGVSNENDYLAINVATDGERHFNDKNTTLLGGLAASFDTIEPTGTAIDAQRPSHETKQSYSVFAGIAQVLSRHAALQSTLSYRFSTGFLSDPYKKSFVGGGPLRDTRPEQRHQVSWLTRVRRHFEQVDGTLHADYSLAIDDWGLTAHTLDLAWHQALWDALQVVPQFRYYSQSQADFYQPTFAGPTPPRFFSSDYRLSPFGALQYGIKATTDFRGFWKTNWEASVSYDRYEQSGDYALGSVSTENPGLVAYHLISFRLSGRF